MEVHFVLLNFGSASAPGDLEFRYEDAPDYTGDAKALTVQAGKNTGNVWHYTAYLDPGWVKIVAAELVNDRESVSLHNPGEYANAYCDGVLRCGVAVIHPEYPDSEPPEYLVDGQSFCADLPNYDAESQGHDDDACQVLGLVWDGKVNLTDPSSVEAHKSAYVALLKSGSGGPAGCKGRFSYRIYFDVSEGETLYAPEQTGSISHVTYCKCPAPEAAE